VRTTIDLPDDLYRALKARAALSGVPLRRLLRQLIEQGLRHQAGGQLEFTGRREPPPVIVPPRGVTVPAVSGEEWRRLEEEEDQARDARSTGRQRLAPPERS